MYHSDAEDLATMYDLPRHVPVLQGLNSRDISAVPASLRVRYKREKLEHDDMPWRTENGQC